MHLYLVTQVTVTINVLSSDWFLYTDTFVREQETE